MLLNVHKEISQSLDTLFQWFIILWISVVQIFKTFFMDLYINLNEFTFHVVFYYSTVGGPSNLFESVENCVYFAVAVLDKIKQ